MQKLLYPENSQTGRSALLGTRPSQVLEHTHPGSKTHTLNPTHILLCLVTQNGSCKMWRAVSKASIKDLYPRTEDESKEKQKWLLQHSCFNSTQHVFLYFILNIINFLQKTQIMFSQPNTPSTLPDCVHFLGYYTTVLPWLKKNIHLSQRYSFSPPC